MAVDSYDLLQLICAALLHYIIAIHISSESSEKFSFSSQTQVCINSKPSTGDPPPPIVKKKNLCPYSFTDFNKP